MFASRQRVEHQPAYLLHAYPWRETSLIADLFTRDHGRLPLAAKGARRKTSAFRGILMAFAPLEVCWTGKGEVKTLTQAVWQGGQPLLNGVALLCGYYLNELLVRLMPREDAHPVLFDAYAAALAQLAQGESHAPLLRAFELTLLRELGYAPTLDCDADTGEQVRADALYVVYLERGPVEATAGVDSDTPLISGRTLQAMVAGDFSSPETLAQTKGLMRRMIHHHLDGQALQSRRILMDLQAL